MVDWFITCVLCIIIISCHVDCKPDKCVSVIMPNITLCTSGNGVMQELPGRPCQHDIDICRRGFNVSFIRLEPISHDTFKNIVKQVIRHCCGSCVNITTVNHFNGMTDISTSSINSSHIVYPILGEVTATSLFGYKFLPFWSTPGAYYITARRTKMAVVKSLIRSCANFWPLLIIMVLTALIAGFIVWIIETWVNKEMFPRRFLPGVLDGFWWSFISMTTVGYGDKVPTFLASRVFSVVWILVGITICSMFTASLTTEVTHVTSPENHDMAGKSIGVLKQRLYDLALVAGHGGVITETKGLSLYDDVVELIDKLQRKDVDGFLLDKFAYIHMIRYFKRTKRNYSQQRYFFMNEILLSEKAYVGNQLAFGMLVKKDEDYDYLKEFIVDNRLTLQTCSNIALNMIDNKIHEEILKDEGHNIFSPESGLFVPTVITICVVIGLIVCFGAVYEIKRRKHKRASLRTVHMQNGGNETASLTTDIPLRHIEG